MPLLRRVARVAAPGAVAGGAADAVQHRQQGRWAKQEEDQRSAQEQQQTATAPAPPEENSMEKLKDSASCTSRVSSPTRSSQPPRQRSSPRSSQTSAAGERR